MKNEAQQTKLSSQSRSKPMLIKNKNVVAYGVRVPHWRRKSQRGRNADSHSHTLNASVGIPQDDSSAGWRGTVRALIDNKATVSPPFAGLNIREESLTMLPTIA